MNGPVYCEQAELSIWFEPFNTITNLAFIAAGILAVIKLKSRNLLDYKAIWLSSVLIIIGVGSFAWHLYRSQFTLISDSVPIAIFILSYLFFYLKYTTRKSYELILLLIGFFIYTPLLIMFLTKGEFFFFENGGASYFSAITYLLVLQIYNYFFKKDVIKKSLIITAVFLFSLLFRQADLLVCKYVGIGTHFMWHILNALTLYLMIQLLYTKKSL